MIKRSFGLALHSLRTRPRLLFAIVLAIFVAVLLPPEWVSSRATRFLIAWNAGTLSYLVLMVHMIWDAPPETIRRHARLQAESRIMTLVLVVLATLAGMVAIFAQLTMVREMHGLARIAHVSLAVLTILSAWAFIHSMFALNYAHDYYDALAHKKPPGLSFPDTADPDYGDFMYCAFIIGTSGQTADVSFTSKKMRRVALVHSVLAFLFNTTMLAMTVNIAAGFL